MFRKRSHCLQWPPASEMERVQRGGNRQQLLSLSRSTRHENRCSIHQHHFSYCRTFSSFPSTYPTAAGEVASQSRPLSLCMDSQSLRPRSKPLPFLLHSLPHHSTNKLHALTQQRHADIFQWSTVVRYGVQNLD